MVIQFIKLRLRETTRSSVWNKNLAINIVFSLFMLYMVVCFLLLGFLLDRMLMNALPGIDPVELLNRGLLDYFARELLVRCLVQNTPAMSITPFLHLPVRRSFLMHFLLARSVVNPVNYVSFLIFVPFAIRAVSGIYSGVAACWWLLALFLTVVFVIYINVYIKRQMVVKPAVSLGCGLVYVALIVLEVTGIFSLAKISSALFGAILQQPLWTLIPVALAVGAYLLNYRFLMIHSYPEEIDRTSSKKKQAAVQNLDFLSRFGHIGELIGLELKLILRHKRTKSVLYIMPFFVFYGLIFYPNPAYKDSLMWLTFVGIIVTGMMMLAYGNFIVAWEGKFFDGILTRKSSMQDYFRAKYYMLVSFCIVGYLLSTPYVFFGTRILWIQTACFLFNVGAGALIMLWFAQYNRRRIELSQGSAFNWQGMGAAQFIVMLPAMLLPMLIAFIFNRMGFGDWGVGALAIIGAVGILCHNRIIQAICHRFTQTKYALADGFRGSN
jgi:hypothetical protein